MKKPSRKFFSTILFTLITISSIYFIFSKYTNQKRRKSEWSSFYTIRLKNPDVKDATEIIRNSFTAVFDKQTTSKDMPKVGRIIAIDSPSEEGVINLICELDKLTGTEIEENTSCVLINEQKDFLTFSYLDEPRATMEFLTIYVLSSRFWQRVDRSGPRVVISLHSGSDKPVYKIINQQLGADIEKALQNVEAEKYFF